MKLVYNVKETLPILPSMNSFILVSKNITQQQTYLHEFIQTHAISPFDSTTISEEGSIGIEIVRKLQQTIYLKPYRGNSKIIILQNAYNLTPEAQNALLKLLEEPPTYTYIFLCAATEDAFLPTVVSRCSLIKLIEEKKEDTSEEGDKILQEQYVVCTTGTVGEKLALAESLSADKETVASWFENMTAYIRRKMLTSIAKDAPHALDALLLSTLLEAYKTFSTTNVSPRTLLEHTFLSI